MNGSWRRGRGQRHRAVSTTLSRCLVASPSAGLLVRHTGGAAAAGCSTPGLVSRDVTAVAPVGTAARQRPAHEPGGEVGLALQSDVQEVAGFEVPALQDVVLDLLLVVGNSPGVLEQLTDGDAASVDPLSPRTRPGRQVSTFASRTIFPSPTSCSTTTAVNVLVLLPISHSYRVVGKPAVVWGPAFPGATAWDDPATRPPAGGVNPPGARAQPMANGGLVGVEEGELEPHATEGRPRPRGLKCYRGLSWVCANNERSSVASGAEVRKAGAHGFGFAERGD